MCFGKDANNGATKRVIALREGDEVLVKGGALVKVRMIVVRRQL